MFCTNCGAHNGENATRCVNCGNLLQRVETPAVEVPSLQDQPSSSSPHPTASSGAVPNLPNYLVQAVLLTIVCFVLSPFSFFFPILGVIPGIIAIIYAAQVNGKVAGGNYAGAAESSRMAKIWCWVTFAFVLIEVTILFFVLLLLLLAALL